MREWFSKQRYNSAEVKGQFSHVAKIIQSFENTKFEIISEDEYNTSQQPSKQPANK